MFATLHNAFDPGLFWEYRVVLLTGLLRNVIIFAESAVLAGVLAFVVGAASLSRHATIRWAAVAYAEFFRNTPEYVLLVWVYFVLPLIIGKVVGSKVNLSPEVAAVLGLGVAYSGFLSETVRAGLRSVSYGQTEAALSLGMSGFTTLRRIVLPQAVRRMLPDTVNQLVSLFKSTTIVSSDCGAGHHVPGLDDQRRRDEAGSALYRGSVAVLRRNYLCDAVIPAADRAVASPGLGISGAD